VRGRCRYKGRVDDARVRSPVRWWLALGLLPGRVTFVIDRQGIVRHVFNSQLQATRHVEEAIAALRALAGA